MAGPLLAFHARFDKLAQARSPFCLGLDPTEELLSAYGLSDNAQGLKSFCRIIVEAAQDHLSLVKPQSAYFERFGPQGMEILRDTVKDFQKVGTLVLLDVKRSDIGSTLCAYAQAYLGSGSAFGANAMTATAYLGFDALKPLFERAAKTSTAVFVVVASSNPEGEALQSARMDNGKSIIEHLADAISDCNKTYAQARPAHAVIGATRADVDAKFLARLNGALVLAPGIGAQGAKLDKLPPALLSVRQNLIPMAARSVLGAGPDIKSLARAITAHCESARLIQNQ